MAIKQLLHKRCVISSAVKQVAILQAKFIKLFIFFEMDVFDDVMQHSIVGSVQGIASRIGVVLVKENEDLQS